MLYNKKIRLLQDFVGAAEWLRLVQGSHGAASTKNQIVATYSLDVKILPTNAGISLS